jgi:nucleoside-diphosphate-sugar epimerase
MRAPLRVLVTGAGGFVGGYLARWFAALEYDVTAVVREERPTTFPPSIRVTAGDLSTPRHLASVFDVLIHCAAVIPARCPDPDRLYAENVAAAGELFGLATSVGARAVIFTSSMSVYGQISASVVTEDLAPVAPDRYGQSKMAGELLLQDAVARGLGSGLSLRLPGTVGRGSHDNFLSDALGRVQRGEMLHGRHPDALFNNVLYIGALAVFLTDWVRNPRPGYHVANLAACDAISVRRMFAALFEVMGRKQCISFDDSGKAPFLIATEHAQGLGFQPMSVEDSILCFAKDCLAAADHDAATSWARRTLRAS